MTEDNADIPSWIPGCPGIDQGTIYFTYAKAHMHHCITVILCKSLQVRVSPMTVALFDNVWFGRNCSLHEFESCEDLCEVVLLLLFGWFLEQKALEQSQQLSKWMLGPWNFVRSMQQLELVSVTAIGCPGSTNGASHQSDLHCQWMMEQKTLEMVCSLAAA